MPHEFRRGAGTRAVSDARRGVVHLDGTYSALQPETVIRAIIAALRSSPAQPGSTSVRSQRGAASVASARRAIADLVGSTADCVVLGSNVSTLLQRFAWLVAREWQLGDEIVRQPAGPDANIRPWVTAAPNRGSVVHWAEVDVETGELPTWQYEQLINTHTRVVTLPLANPATGVVPEVRAIADLAHAMGAVVVVDAGRGPAAHAHRHMGTRRRSARACPRDVRRANGRRGRRPSRPAARDRRASRRPPVPGRSSWAPAGRAARRGHRRGRPPGLAGRARDGIAPRSGSWRR